FRPQPKVVHVGEYRRAATGDGAFPVLAPNDEPARRRRNVLRGPPRVVHPLRITLRHFRDRLLDDHRPTAGVLGRPPAGVAAGDVNLIVAPPGIRRPAEDGASHSRHALLLGEPVLVHLRLRLAVNRKRLRRDLEDNPAPASLPPPTIARAL